MSTEEAYKKIRAAFDKNICETYSSCTVEVNFDCKDGNETYFDIEIKWSGSRSDSVPVKVGHTGRTYIQATGENWEEFDDTFIDVWRVLYLRKA